MILIFIITLIIIILYILIYENYKSYKNYYSLNIKYNNNILIKPKKIYDLSNIHYQINNDKFKNFKTINISIIPFNNYYVSVVRIGNFFLDFNISNLIKSNNIEIENYQLLNIMDKNFNIIKQQFLNIDCSDIKLFNKNGKILFSCNYLDDLTNNCDVLIGEFDDNFNISKIVKPTKNFFMIKYNEEKTPIYISSLINLFESLFYSRKTKLITQNYHKWEKNWTLFDYNDIPHIIYKWYPLHICKINDLKLDLVEVKNMPDIFAFCRGSTNGFTYNDMIWFIVHKSTTYKSYFHMLVIFDKYMNLKGYISDFKFENCIVEFCLGLIINNNDIIISYSTYDSNCKIGIYDKKQIETLITWI